MRGVFEKKWLLDIRELISTPPTVIPYSNEKPQIIIGTKSGKIFSISNEGKINWIFKIKKETSKENKQIHFKNKILDKPLFVRTKKIILFVTKNTLCSLDQEGNLQWETNFENKLKHSPTLNNKNELILATDEGIVYFLDMEGNIKKRIKIDQEITTPITSYENKLLFGTKSGELFFISDEGKEIWNFKTKNSLKAKITIIEDYKRPIIILPAEDHNLYALTLDGEILWNYETKGSLTTEIKTINISRNQKNIVFGSHDNNIYCISSEGELLWSYETDFKIETTPIISKTSYKKTRIIVGSRDFNIYLLDSNGKFNLKNIPGLSNVVNQSTTEISSLSKELGTDNGKLLGKINLESPIKGCELIGTTEIIIVTQEGKLYAIKLIA